MIRTLMVDKQGNEQCGSGELIETWKTHHDNCLWLDLIDEPQASERELLIALGCHELAIADALRSRHPPKFEVFADHTFILYRGFKAISEDLQVDTMQLALWIGPRILITRRNGPSLGVNTVWENPERGNLLVEPAVLAMRILVASANGYLDGVLQFEQTLSELEETMLDDGSDDLMQSLVVYKSRLRQLRRTFSYHERVFASLNAAPTPHVASDQGEVQHQVQDVYEKLERLHSLTGMYYELCGDLLDGYLSISSHRLNKTMQVLTIITAIFVPIGFLAGLYGMNFEYMPELQVRGGYFVLLGVMAALASSLLVMFRRKGWL